MIRCLFMFFYNSFGCFVSKIKMLFHNINNGLFKNIIRNISVDGINNISNKNTNLLIPKKTTVKSKVKKTQTTLSLPPTTGSTTAEEINDKQKTTSSTKKTNKNTRKIKTKELVATKSEILVENEILVKNKDFLEDTVNRIDDQSGNSDVVADLAPPFSLNKNQIPFTVTQINQMINYPLFHNTSKVLQNHLTDNNKQSRYVPSVTKILQSTMSESSRLALMNWKIHQIAELGEEGFRELQQNHLKLGATLHSSIQNYFLHKEVPSEDSSIYQLWQSVQNALNIIDDQPILMEASVVHPILQYKGIVDCVSTIKNEVTVIEWKKSDSEKTTVRATYDAPLQLCAYLGALNLNGPSLNLQPIRKGMVVVAYTNGKPAHCHHLDEIDLQKYWRIWLFRLQQYWIMYRDGTIPPPV